MQLLESWKESLRFFDRKNLELFALVTLKTIKTTYSHIARYLGIPIGLFLLVTMLLGPKNTVDLDKRAQVLLWVCRTIFLLIVYLTVRPSVTRKNLRYYVGKLQHRSNVVIALVLLALLLVLAYVGYWSWVFVTPFVTFAIFFHFDLVPDKDSFIVAWVNAVKMVLYNLPVCLAIMSGLLALWSLFMVIVYAVQYVIPIQTADAVCLFIPVEACILANLYIKWLHEQFAVYFAPKLKDGVS